MAENNSDRPKLFDNYRTFFGNVRNAWKVIRNREFAEKYDRKMFLVALTLFVVAVVLCIRYIIKAVSFFVG